MHHQREAAKKSSAALSPEKLYVGAHVHFRRTETLSIIADTIIMGSMRILPRQLLQRQTRAVKNNHRRRRLH